MGIKVTYKPKPQPQRNYSAGQIVGGSGTRSAAQRSTRYVPTAPVKSDYAAGQIVSAPRDNSYDNGLKVTYTPPKKELTVTYTPPQKSKAQRTVDDLPDIAAFGAGNYGTDKRPNEGYNYGKGLLKAGGMGLSNVSRAVTTPLAFGERMVAKGWNALLGKLAPMNERGLFNAWDESIADYQEGLQQRYAENTAKGGQYAEKAENLGASVVEALPSLAIAFATGGTSAAAKAGDLAAQTAAKSSPALVQTLKQVAAARAKDPNYLSSAAQIFSHSYNDAKAEGVDDKRAALYAIGNALLGSEIEISGGIQNLPAKVENQAAWRTLVNTMLDEGKEEVLQGIIDRSLQNAAYGAGNPLVGVGQNGIIDPAAAAEEFAGGAIVGGLLSGGTMGVQQLLGRVGRQNGTLSAAQATGEVTPAAVDTQTQNAAESRTDGNMGRNENGLTSLTEQEKINLSSGAKNKVVTTFQDAVQFVRNALTNKNNVDRAYLGKVPESTAQRVMQETGVNVDGMGVMMNGVDVRHIIKHHGDPILEQARGQVAVTAEAIARIPEIIADPDAVYLSDTDDGKGRASIVFEKQFGDTYITVQGISNGKNLLQTDTMYIQKGKTRTSRYSMPDAQESAAPENNVRNVPSQGLSSIDTTVPQNAADVNTQDMRSSAEYAPQSDGLGGADRGSLNSEYDQLQAQSSRFYDAGDNAYRPVDVPRTDFDGRPISQTASTVMGAEAIPGTMIPEIEQMVADGKLSYKTASDKQALTRAEHTIRANGFDGAMEKYRTAVRKGTVGKDVEAIGQLLLENAANARDGKAMAELLMLYQQSGTNVGQALQARTMFRKLTPTAQLYGVQKAVDAINENTKRRFKRLRGSAANVPVEEWMSKTGELLADQLAARVQAEPQQAQTVAQTVLSDLRKFAQQTVAKAEVGIRKRSDMERIYDLFHNREKYQEAWDAAKRTVAEKYGSNAAVMDALDEWYNGAIDYTDMFTKAVTGQTDVKVDDALMTKFLEQTDQEGRDAVLEEIYQNVADQMPATWYEKWNAIRYLDMLANTRTHVRNIAGNAGFQPLRWTKDRIAGAIEAGLQKAGKDVERTKSFTLAGKDLYKAAWDDFANVAQEMSGNKYQDAKSAIQDKRNILGALGPAKTPWLEKLRRFNGDALSAEDTVFKRITYADALAGYLKANGATAAQMADGSVDADLLTQGREYAAREAMRATFNDKNAVSDAVVRAARGLGPFGEAVLPFKRTPANILVRGVEYSPAGLAKGIADLGFRVQSGKVTAAQAIDEIASGLTGSALLALGALLASKGLVRGGDDDDDREQSWNDLLGHQNYALELPNGTSVTLDWLAPEAIPFFMGVNLASSVGENGWTADAVVGALRSIADPMLEMSMLSSMNDILESKKYEEGSAVEKVVTSALVTYFSQGVPTALGQLNRILEDKRMTTYVDKNSTVLTRGTQQLLGKLSGKIPGMDANRIPYIDAWGQEEETGDVMTRLINNTLNPAYVSKVEMDGVEKELARLGKVVGSGVYPSRAAKSFAVNGETKNLTAQEYVKYAKTLGQGKHEMLEAAFQLDGYKRLSNADKAEMITTLYQYANEKAKRAVTSQYTLSSGAQKYADAEKAGISPAEWYLLKNSADADGNGRITQKEAKAAMAQAGLTRKEMAAVWPLFSKKWGEKNPYK